ncbi:MAG: PLP-dependent aspartate aminotransferase family protein [Thermomicrobiales bacterium]|nr:PLP-dependent aspartate aminotransferase family protein [Thermomicrobiales bacterium]
MSRQLEREDLRRRGAATRAVHAGERIPLPIERSTTTPIFPTTTFLHPDLESLDAVFGGEQAGYNYSRHGNPTIRALEVAMAALEETDDAIAFGSGMAALHAAILACVTAGSKIVASRELFGATYTLLQAIFDSLEVESIFVDQLDLEEMESAIASVRPRAVLVETISNPLLNVAHLPLIAEWSHAVGATVICDNTFATPVLVNPSKFGIDLVMHSTTKYIGGHGDVLGGVICGDTDRIEDLIRVSRLAGGVIGPFEAWLTLRGVKTMPLRVRQQSESASLVAAWLAQHPAIDCVFYPGYSCSTEAAAVFNDDRRGGMVSFEIANAGRDEVFRFLDALEVFLPGTSLGDVYSLAVSPPMSTHRALDEDAQVAIGINPGLIRLSIGIEDVEDLIADLDQALRRIYRTG